MTSNAGPEEAAMVACNLCGARVDRSATAFVKEGHRIVRCPGCTLLFRFDLPDEHELAEIYSDAYFRATGTDAGSGEGYLDYVSEEERHRDVARMRLRRLAGFRRSDTNRLLDVGTAAGFFLSEAEKQGWTGEGVELSLEMAQWGREQLHVAIVSGAFLDRSLDGPYDLITMWDYLEHTLDPRAELQRAGALLRHSGALALSTGDASSRVARISGARWHLLTPRHHNYYFTPKTLGRYLEREGFQVLETNYPWSSYSAAYLAHKVQTMTRSKITRRIAESVRGHRVGRIAIPVNLWDIMTVVAQKA